MQNLILIAALSVPLVAFAQAEAETPVEVKPAAPPIEPVHAAVPIDQPVHAAVPVLPSWTVGAGLTLGTGLSSFAAPSQSGLLGGLGALTGTLGVSATPRMTMLIERRLNDYLFLAFGAGLGFSGNQIDAVPGYAYRQFNVEGSLGLRRVINPGGVVEISWFANVGLSYANAETRSTGLTFDPLTGAQSTEPLSTLFASQSFGFGGATGITLERELVSGLALRLSSSVLGIGYGSNSGTTTVGENSRKASGHGFDGGLRFSPTIELRYAF